MSTDLTERVPRKINGDGMSLCSRCTGNIIENARPVESAAFRLS